MARSESGFLQSHYMASRRCSRSKNYGLDWKKTMQETHLGIYLAALLSIGVGIAGWVLLKVVAIESRLASFAQWLQDHEKMDHHNAERITERLTSIEVQVREAKDRVYKVDREVEKRQSQIMTALTVIQRRVPARQEEE